MGIRIVRFNRMTIKVCRLSLYFPSGKPLPFWKMLISSTKCSRNPKNNPFLFFRLWLECAAHPIGRTTWSRWFRGQHRWATSDPTKLPRSSRSTGPIQRRNQLSAKHRESGVQTKHKEAHVQGTTKAGSHRKDATNRRWRSSGQRTRVKTKRRTTKSSLGQTTKVTHSNCSV